MKGLGFIPDLPDVRDRTFSTVGVIKAKTVLPPTVKLLKSCPPIRDQGRTGACTAFATTALVDYLYNLHDHPHKESSPLFTYYNTRKIEGTVQVDSGATLRNTIKSIVKEGASTEEVWPYIESKFRDRPLEDAYTVAETRQALEYGRVNQSQYDICYCLHEGYPIVFGFSVYESMYEEWPTKTLPLPNAGESLLGGHAVMLVGYNLEEQTFLVRNSWGNSWGDDGYFLMPFSYVLDPNLSMDFWTIRLMED